MTLATNWVDGIGMFVNAAYLNGLGTEHNAVAQGRPTIGTVTSSATPSINTDNYTQFNITALATAITSMSSGLSGTPADGQKLVVRIEDNGSPWAITWGASWRAIGVTLPTKTIPGSVLYVEAFYNSHSSIWDVHTVRKLLIPVQVRGGNSAVATSVAIPAHQPGDLIMIFGYDKLAAGIPAPPAAGGTVPAYALVGSGTNAAPSAASVYQFIATASNHTSGTWTNTTGLIAVVLRGEDTATPIGAQSVATIAASATQSVSTTVTPTKTDKTSALLYFHAMRSVTAWGSAPAGYTQVTKDDTLLVCNSKTDTSSDGAATQTMTGSSGSGMGAVVEVLMAT